MAFSRAIRKCIWVSTQTATSCRGAQNTLKRGIYLSRCHRQSSHGLHQGVARRCAHMFPRECSMIYRLVTGSSTFFLRKKSSAFKFKKRVWYMHYSHKRSREISALFRGSVAVGAAPGYSSTFPLAKTGSDPGRSASQRCPAPTHRAPTFLGNTLASRTIKRGSLL